MKKITKHTETLIIGGGAAGVAAAVGAARAGKMVTLLERAPFLGGKATAAYVGTICGLYLRSERQLGQYVSEGFVKEFAEKLGKACATQPFFYKKGLQFLPYTQTTFQRHCDDWLKQAKVDLYLQSTVHSARVEEGRIVEITALVHDQNVVFRPKEVIDCSGEAIVAELTGIDVIKSDEYQAGAQVFSMINVAKVDASVLNLSLIRLFKQAIAANQLPNDYNRISIVPGLFKDGQIVLKIGLPKVIDNQLNKVTDLQLLAREMVKNAAQFLQKNSPYFKNSTIGMIASEAGIRTGKRHLGQYILTREDVLSCQKFENSSAHGTWPIEDWRVGQNPSMEYFAMEDYYDIPLECLISNQLKNLRFAGRNISADDDAIASARVIGTCLQTGYAAGGN